MPQDNETYSVAVIATMSAGKSTLLNALIGCEMLPSRNEACTATIYKIREKDGQKGIIGRYCDKNNEWTPWEETLTYDKLEYWNQLAPSQIELCCDLPNIDNGLAKRDIVFIDTPGPNNSVNVEHAQITEKIIEDSVFCSLIFVINNTYVPSLYSNF